MNCHDSLLKISKENTSILASSLNVYINKAFVVCSFKTMHGLSNFRQGGGGGGSRLSRQKNPLTTFLFLFYFSHQLIFSYTEFSKENYISHFLKVLARTEVQLGSNIFQRGGVQLFSRGRGVNADFYRNLVIFQGGGLNPHIPAPLDPRMLTLDLLITSTYISHHAVYFNPRPVFTGTTNEFFEMNCFTSVFLFYFFVFKILKTIMYQNILNLLKVLREIHNLNVGPRKIGSGSLTLVLAFILPM